MNPNDFYKLKLRVIWHLWTPPFQLLPASGLCVPESQIPETPNIRIRKSTIRNIAILDEKVTQQIQMVDFCKLSDLPNSKLPNPFSAVYGPTSKPSAIVISTWCLEVLQGVIWNLSVSSVTSVVSGGSWCLLVSPGASLFLMIRATQSVGFSFLSDWDTILLSC